MKVKTFQGRSIEEVLPQIRAELGENAVILSQKPMVSGGIGGFFGKRMIEVVAADRMPSDQELIDIDDSLGRDEPVTMSTSERRQILDVHDDWDPASDDELAREFGGIFERAASRREEVAPNLNLEEQFTHAVAQANVPSGNAAVLESAMSTGAMIDPQALAKLQQAARAQVQAQAQEPHLQLVESQEDVVQSNLKSIEESDFAPMEPPLVQAEKLAQLAHQSIAEATRALDEHAFGVVDSGTTLRAEVVSPADTSIMRVDSSNPAVSPERREAIRNMQIDSTGLIGDPHGVNPIAATRIPSSLSPQNRAITEAAKGLEQLLGDAGVDVDVANIIVTRVLSHRRPFSATSDLRELTRETIAEQIRVATGWAPKTATHKLAVVGPSGAGKSSIVAKLAESYSRIVGLRVGIISIVHDQYQPDMRSETILRRPGLDVRMVTNPSQMLDAIESLHGADVIMIDTPSSAYLDKQSFSAVSRCLDAAQVDDVYAVVPLATSIREAGSVIDHFAPMQVNRLVVSKLDESRYAGQLLNLCFHFGLPITLLSDGPRVPEDIRAASAREIAELILPRSEEK